MLRKNRLQLSIVVLLCSTVAGGLAQIRSGTLVGKVVDPTGASVPDASIRVQDVETNTSSETLTNSAGEYTVPYLAPGRYRVSVTRPGFVTARTTEIEIGTATTVRADVKLELGTVTNIVEVLGTIGDLQTESSAVQNVVSERVIQTLPNITQNPYYYATLQPGVVPRATLNDSQSVRAFGVGQDARRQYSALSINGGIPFTNDVQLDGLSIMSPTFNEATVVPNPDGLMEVRTSVNNYAAEYGRGQGVISVTTKSGTNQFHGTASERFRNEALNANTFGNNQQSIARPAFKVNTYGGTLGGPIQKDRVFFFVSYEGLKHSQNIDYFATLPTALERKGDFSQTVVNVGGAPVSLKLYDPFNVVQLGPDIYQRVPVPNSIIPNPDPYVQKIFSYYPMPNRPPLDVYQRNNYYLRGAQDFSRNSLNSRLDYHLGKHSVYWTGGFFQGSITATKSWGEDNPFVGGAESFSGGQGLLVGDKNLYGSIGDTIVLSPTLVADIRYGVTRQNSKNTIPGINNFDYNQFGIPAEIQAINPAPTLPPASSWGGGWSALQVTSPHLQQYATNHATVGSLTKTINRWTLKFGGEYRVYLSTVYSPKVGIDFGSATSVVQPIASYTRQMINAAGTPIGVVNADQAGNGAASMLLGAGQIGIWSSNGKIPPTLAQKYGAVYGQTDWHATSRLTVNLGVRWDVQPGATDRFNNICGFDFSGTNPFGGGGAVACAGANGYSRNIYDTEWRNFGPRGGLAYRVSDTFVIRAGYGLTYLPTNTGFRASPFDWGMDSFVAYTNNDPYGPTPNGNLIGRYNSPLVNRIVPPFGSDVNSPYFYGGLRQQKFNRHFPTQTMQQWNLFLQKRIGSTWLVSAGYTAAKGSHLLFSRVPITDKQLIPQSLLDSWRQGYIQANGTTNPGTQQIPNPFQPAGKPLIPFNGSYGRATISREEANIPYPLFASNQVQEDVGWSNYNALVVQAERRFSKGVLVSGHYTWSKSEDFSESEAIGNDFFDTGSLTQDAGSWWNLRNLRANYGPSYFHVPHRAVISYVYELPFGAGRRFNSNHAGLRAVISGWQTGGVATFQSGTPLIITGANSGSLNGRPNRVPGVPVKVPAELQRWYDGNTTVALPDGRKITPCANCYLVYNPDAFQGQVVTTPNGSVVNDVYWFGNAAQRYNDILSPGVNNWNMSVSRTFRPKESLFVDFAAQFTNAFNHTQFRPAMNMALGATSVAVNSPQGIQPGQGQSGTFGTHGNSTYDPRQVELTLKIRF
jgi:hypothetical protein